MAGDRGRPLGVAKALVVLGWLGLAIAGLSAARYSPEWLGDEYRCRLEAECTAEEIASGVRLHWWLVGLCGAVVLVGIVVLLWSLSPASRSATARRLPALAQAAATGAAAVALPFALFPVGVLLFLSSAHAAVAAAVGTWLAQALLVSALHRRFAGRTSPRGAAAVGLLVSAAALALTAWLTTQGQGSTDLWAPVLMHAGSVAVLVALVRLFRDPLPQHVGAARRRALAVVGVVVLGAVGVAATLVLRQPDAYQPAGAPTRPTFPAPEPPAPAPSGPAAPTPEPPPEPVVAHTPCAPGDLDVVVTGFDAALGARAASLRATNTGSRPCYVDGFPVVTLLQGGRPLSLTVENGSTASPGTPGTAQRVGVAPGGAAVAGLYWRSYGGLADSESPQSVTVAFDGSKPPLGVPVDSPYPGAAPFDIADGGTWQVGNWEPAST